jgi:hypothetical protein
VNKVIQDLQLASIEYDADYTNQAGCIGVRGIELIDKLLLANRISLKLKELQVKTQDEKEGTWQLCDRLLLRLEKLYVSNS